MKAEETRTKFEEWNDGPQGQGFGLRRYSANDPDLAEEYCSELTQAAWLAWQAALASSDGERAAQNLDFETWWAADCKEHPTHAGEKISVEKERARRSFAVRDGERERLRTALRKLAKEASGFLRMASKDEHGVTNMVILQERIDEAERALAEAPK